MSTNNNPSPVHGSSSENNMKSEGASSSSAGTVLYDGNAMPNTENNELPQPAPPVASLPAPPLAQVGPAIAPLPDVAGPSRNTAGRNEKHAKVVPVDFD